MDCDMDMNDSHIPDIAHIQHPHGLHRVSGKNRLPSTACQGRNGNTPLLALFVQEKDYALLWLQGAVRDYGFDVEVVVPERAVDAVQQHQQSGVRLLIVIEADKKTIREKHICPAIRNHTYAPIVVIVTNGHTEDVVLGIQQGADIVLCHPFDLHTAVLRIQSVVRRAYHLNPIFSPLVRQNLGWEPDIYTYGDLQVDYRNNILRVRDMELHLTPLEAKLLSYLMEHANQVVTKQDLLRNVWNTDDPAQTNLVASAIRRLRTKLEEDPSDPHRLVTVHRMGYMLLRHNRCD